MISVPRFDDSFDDEPESMRLLSPTQKDRLGVLLEQYLAGMENGVPPTVESLTCDDPMLAEPLQECVAGLENLHRMAAGSAPSTSSASSSASEISSPAISSVSGQSSSPGSSVSDMDRVLGDFTLHEQIGRGGMGIVYRATQTSLRRTVAIKLLPLSATLDPQKLTRFQHEAEAAAMLQHPNIVPVFAIDCKRSTHFYAMQYIEGDSVDVQIERDRNLSGSQRSGAWSKSVRQAIDIADALHAAHSTGIVHRDVKPSNLIIDRNEKIWITDFGLARVHGDSTLTKSGDVLGTVRYMSPEQARGQAALVDGRSDVYSLGGTLFEMLSGTPAYDGEDLVEQATQWESGIVPSVLTAQPHLPRDLDTVLVKAMSPHRDDRYETAADFADDLRRVLDGRPTLARPPSLIDRTTRLVNRHRRVCVAGLGVIAVGIVGIVIGSALLATQTHLANQHAARAEESTAVARDIVDRLVSQIAESLRDVPAATEIRHHLLTETLDYYQQLADSPATQGDLAVTFGQIGQLQSELGMHGQAESSLVRCESMFEQLATRHTVDHQTQLQWSISQNNLAQLYATRGKTDSAAALFAKAIATQKVLELDLGKTATLELVTTLNNLGQLLTSTKDVWRAEEVFEQALHRSARCESPITPTIESNLARVLVRLDDDRAEQFAAKSVQSQLERLEADPTNPKAAAAAAATLNTLALVQAKLANHRDAVETLTQSIDISRQLRGRFPNHIAYRRDLGVGLNHLGASLAKLGRHDRALQTFEKAHGHAEALRGVYPNDAGIRRMSGSILCNLATVHQQLGNNDDARRFYKQATEHNSIADRL